MSNKQNPVGWFEIYVQDMSRARAFYEAVFQVKLQELPSPIIKMWAFPMQREASGAAGALVHMPGVESKMGGTIVYFTCDDCAVESDRASKNGGKVHKPKFPIGDYGFISLVYDTEGNMFGLHSMK
jgi:predicted enzyme related to lactoylglutathione lyase